jgi:CBS domain-containing protein
LVKKDSIHIGIITGRDFAIKIMANKYPSDTPIDKVASMPLQTIGPNESILDAANQMSLKKIRKIVVENNKVVGIMTSTDLTNQYLGLKIKSIK